MRVAVISDIHGNKDALAAVLERAKAEHVEHLLILGDIVGYYYYPEIILNMLSKWRFDMIKGNHEYILENLLAEPHLAESIRLKYGSGHQEAINKLDDQQLEFLRLLPDKKTVQIEEISFLLCHGSPWENDFYIYPDCKKETVMKCDSNAHDFILIGHSHYSFAFKNPSSILLNPGSVGQSRQTGGKASWALIDTTNGCFQLKSTDYKVEDLICEIKNKDPDIKYLSEILIRN